MKNHARFFRLAFALWAAVQIQAIPMARAAEYYVAYVGPVTVDTRRPDLQVAALDTPLEALAASTQPVAWTILNGGGKALANGWVDRVFLSTNAAVGGDRLLGEFPASGPLETNQALPRIQNIALPADLEPDRDYWWIVVTDAANAIDESNKVNNARVSDQPMRVLRAPAPNLRVASVFPPANPMSGEPVTLIWAVTNAGTWSTGAGLWQDAVYLSTNAAWDAADLPLGRAARPHPLSTNDSYGSSLTATLPQGISGPWHFIVTADADNRVLEGTGEGDNAAASAPVVVGLTPPPDLQVAAIQSPTSAASGESITVAWTVINAGPGVTVEAAWFDDVYLSPTPALSTNAIFLGAFPHEGVLTDGQTYDSPASIPLPNSVSGTFYLLLHTDARSNVFEHVFETNNVTAGAAPITITLTPPPDLAVSGVQAPATALASHPISLAYTVTNKGTDTLLAFFWEDQVYLSTNPLPPFSPGEGEGVIFLGSAWHFGGLLSGASYTNTFEATLPDGLSGTYYAIAVTDSGNEVFELNETNNATASLALQVQSRPADLVVTALSAPASGQAGFSLLVSWSVENRGSGDTVVRRWSDRLWLSTDMIVGNADDVALLTLEQTGLLDPGASYTASDQVVTVPFSVGPGTWRLFAVTDTGNAVYEGANEGNNTSSAHTIAITRQTSDLRLAEVLVLAAPTNPTTVAQAFQPAVSPTFQSAGGSDSPAAVPLDDAPQDGNPAIRSRAWAGSTLQVFSEATLLVSWRVENTGATPPNSSVWADAIYLSPNAVFNTNAILLGIRQNPASLGPGAFYTNAVPVELPAEIQGDFFVHVVADAAGQVIEDNKANNTLAATNTLRVTLRPVPDLAVVSVTTPADGFSGQFFEMSWTVTNRGPATAEGTWFDSVYLSLDTQFEPGLDTYIGYAERPHALTNGQSYTQTALLEIPPDVSGLLHVFVVCDSTDRVNERGATTNNVRRAPVPVAVWIRPPADLVVGTITIPANAVAGYEMALTYTLHNQGTNAAFGPWVDALYLSTDDQWDIGDTLLTRVGQGGFLAVGGSRTNTVSAPAPGVVPGDYRVIIRTDLVNQVPETNEFNNITATLDQVATEVDELVFGVPSIGSISPGRSVYYKLAATNGQTIRIAFNAQSPESASQVFVGSGVIPTRGQFNYTFNDPFVSAAELIMPAEQTGSYFIMVYGGLGTSSFAIQVDSLSFLIARASPNTAGDAGMVTLKVEGAWPTTNITFALTNTNGTAFDATDVALQDSATAFVTFNCLGAPPGSYRLEVQIQGTPTRTGLADALTIKPGEGARVDIDLDAGLRVFTGRINPLKVTYENVGDADTMAPLIVVYNPGGWQLGFAQGTVTSTALQVLGLNDQGPMDILRVGVREAVALCFTADAADFDAGLRARAILADDTAVLTETNWQEIEASVRPLEMSDAQWRPFWANIRSRVGATWGDYVRFLNRLAEQSAPSVPVGRDVRAMFAALMRANSNFRASSFCSGQLLDAADSSPRGGVTICAYRLELERHILGGSATTAADGTFTIAYLAPGEYELALVDGGFDMDHDGKIDSQGPAYHIRCENDLTGLLLYARHETIIPEYQDDTDPVLTVDSVGTTHILWRRGDRVWHAYFDGSEWTASQPISHGAGASLRLQAAPNLLDGIAPGLIATWEEGVDNGAEIFMAVARPKKSGGFEWSQPIQLTSDSLQDGSPAVVVTETGQVLITYLKSDAVIRDDADIYFLLLDLLSLGLPWSSAEGLVAAASPANVTCHFEKAWPDGGGFDAFGTSFTIKLSLDGAYSQNGCSLQADHKGELGVDFRFPGFGRSGFGGGAALHGSWHANQRDCAWQFDAASLDASASGSLDWKHGLVRSLYGIGPEGVLVAEALIKVINWIEKWGLLEVEDGVNFEAKVDFKDLRWTRAAPFPAWILPDYLGQQTITVKASPYLKIKTRRWKQVDVKISGDLTGTWQLIPSFKFVGFNGCLVFKARLWAFKLERKVPKDCDEPPSEDLLAAQDLQDADFVYAPNEAIGTTNVYGTNALRADVAADVTADSAPVLARSRSDRTVAVWSKEGDPFAPKIGSELMMADLQASNWSSPTALPNSFGLVGEVDVIFADDDHLLVVWSTADSSAITTNLTQEQWEIARDSSDLFYSVQVAGLWSAPIRLAATPGPDGDLCLFGMANGEVRLAWLYRDGLGARHLVTTIWSGSQWSSLVEITNGPIASPALAELASTPVLFWARELGQSSAAPQAGLFYSQEIDGAWSPSRPFRPELLPPNNAVAQVAGRGLGVPCVPPEVPKQCCACDKYTKVRRGSGDCVVKTEIDEETCTEYTTYKPCRSYDPNDILGPVGFGTGQWVSADETFRYTVRFENDPVKAKLPAQIVRVTQRLDPNLDLTTFRLEHMGFGDILVTVPPGRVFYQARLNATNALGVFVDITAGLDLATQEVTWEFTSIDPTTGDLPWDIFAGFLPPNTNGIIGQGFVTYTIKPKAGIASGDIVNAEARIFFDYNEPMDTPRIFNTVDASLPTSTVLPLPATTNRNVFPVQWLGADGYGGAGIGGFDIYVSDNGGPWRLWLQSTPYWEQLFVGECGHVYEFYSVARDNVGHVESALPAAQAQIYLLPNTAPVLSELTNRVMAVGQRLSITNLVADADVPAQSLRFSLDPGAPAGMSVDPETGVLQWRPTCVQGNSSHLVTVRATDDGCGNLSSTATFVVTVTECLQAAFGGTVTEVGQSGCVPVYLESSDNLTTLAVTLQVPPGKFTNFTATAAAPEVESAELVSLNATQALVLLSARVGEVMRGPKQVATLCFTLVSPQESAFLPLEVVDIVGLRAGGGPPVGNSSGRAGRAVVVGEGPLLEASHDANGQPFLTLYAQPGTTNILEYTTRLSDAPSWTHGQPIVMTNLSHVIQPVCTNRCTLFFRAKRL